MQVDSYIFKSPYHSPVQTGQVDPTSKKEEPQESKTEVKNDVVSETPQNTASYKAEQKQAQNVANSTSNISLQGALDFFSNVNSQVKAQQAYA